MNDDYTIKRLITTIFSVLFIVICVGLNIVALCTAGVVGLVLSCIVTLPTSVSVAVKAAKSYAGEENLNLKQFKSNLKHQEDNVDARNVTSAAVAIEDCRFCTHCGALIEKDAKNCPDCGSVL